MARLGAVLLVAGCGLTSQPESVEIAQNPAPITDTPKLDSSWPTTAVPAFVPRGQGCVPPYAPLHEACAHAAFVARNDSAVVEAQFARYRKGVVPPKVGGPPETPVVSTMRRKKDLKDLDPGALTKSGESTDPEAAKERRLRGLETMLQMANARLAQQHRPASASAATPGQKAVNTAAPGSSVAASGGSATSGNLMTQVQSALQSMQQGQAATLLQQMERQGLRKELGEDVWSQLSTSSR